MDPASSLPDFEALGTLMAPLAPAMGLMFVGSALISFLILKLDPQPGGKLRAGAVGLGGAFILASLFLVDSIFSVTPLEWHQSEGDWLSVLIPQVSYEWLAYLVLAATILGPASVTPGVPWTERVGLRILLSLLIAWFLTPPEAELSDWSSYVVDRSSSLGFLAVVSFLLISGLDLLAMCRPGLALSVLLLINFIVAMFVTRTGTAQSIADLMTLAVLGVFGLTLTCCSRDGKAILRAAVPVVVTLLVGITYISYTQTFYFDEAIFEDPWAYGLDLEQPPALSFLLVIVAPLILLPVLLLPKPWKTGFRGFAIMVVLLAIPLGVAVAPATQILPQLIAEATGEGASEEISDQEFSLKRARPSVISTKICWTLVIG